MEGIIGFTLENWEVDVPDQLCSIAKIRQIPKLVQSVMDMIGYGLQRLETSGLRQDSLLWNSILK